MENRTAGDMPGRMAPWSVEGRQKVPVPLNPNFEATMGRIVSKRYGLGLGRLVVALYCRDGILAFFNSSANVFAIFSGSSWRCAAEEAELDQKEAVSLMVFLN